MTTFSKLGPYKGKIVDIQPVSSSVMELTIESIDEEAGGKKFKYEVGGRSEFVRRVVKQGDNKVSFTLDERGKITVLTKLRRP